MISRTWEIQSLQSHLRQFPVVGILGPRQSGKTTLARSVAKIKKNPVTYFDLENPEDLTRLADPMLTLKPLRGLVILDEIQRRPELFPVLRVLADRPGNPARFLVLGSASPDLLRQSSESLAGRIVYHELGGFSLDEIGIKNLKRLWFRGGFPLSYLAPSASKSYEWRRSFIQTFLERDLPQLGIQVPSATLRRFWQMLAHYHGGRWNSSEFARSFGVADTTIRHYLDVLTSAFVVRQLSPWHENISKRQVKAPKIYIADSGILHTLMGIPSEADLEVHPKVGASWEGFVLKEVIRRLGARPEECFHWAAHAGAELDLLVVRGRFRYGFEIKRTTTPALTPSMRIAMSDLKLSHLDLIHGGDYSFPLDKKIRAVSLTNLLKEVKRLPD